MTKLYLKNLVNKDEDYEKQYKKCLVEWLSIRQIIKDCKENSHLDCATTIIKNFNEKWSDRVGCFNVLFEFLEEDLYNQKAQHYVR